MKKKTFIKTFLSQLTKFSAYISTYLDDYLPHIVKRSGSWNTSLFFISYGNCTILLFFISYQSTAWSDLLPENPWFNVMSYS